MDNGRSLWPVHHDQLKKSSSPISAEKQIPNWVFCDLLDNQCVAYNVLDVFRFDVVPKRRAEDLHGKYRTTKPASVPPIRARAQWGQIGLSFPMVTAKWPKPPGIGGPLTPQRCDPEAGLGRGSP